MPINLKQLTPHKVSRDLSGYITYVYGPGGRGKTTLGAQMPSPLLLAFEKGYNALPGVLAQDVTTWAEMKQVLRQLDDPDVKGMFRSVVVDTVDIAAQLCEQFVCNQLGVENIGDGGWKVNGWKKVKTEWENTFRSIAMKGYAVLFISHAKEKKITLKDNTEYNQIIPSVSSAYNTIIRDMSDIQGYIEIANNERTLILRSPNDSVECKSRFKMIEPRIPFSYQSLVDALNAAIDKEAAMTGHRFVTDEREKVVEAATYDYDALMNEFNDITNQLMEKDSEYYLPRIMSIIEKYFGKGKKISDATIDQAELIFLVVDDMKNDLL